MFRFMYRNCTVTKSYTIHSKKSFITSSTKVALLCRVRYLNKLDNFPAVLLYSSIGRPCFFNVLQQFLLEGRWLADVFLLKFSMTYLCKLFLFRSNLFRAQSMLACVPHLSILIASAPTIQLLAFFCKPQKNMRATRKLSMGKWVDGKKNSSNFWAVISPLNKGDNSRSTWNLRFRHILHWAVGTWRQKRKLEIYHPEGIFSVYSANGSPQMLGKKNPAYGEAIAYMKRISHTPKKSTRSHYSWPI